MNTPKQLTREHLCAYMPYDVAVKSIGIFEGDPTFILSTETYSGKYSGMDWVISEGYEHFKLILRPLSDLTKEITHNGETFVPIERLQIINPDGAEHFMEEVMCGFAMEILVRQLRSWHFDVFGLINAGLAIDRAGTTSG